jgi:hypothetical protein
MDDVVSPELVLVAPPELARLAREQLPIAWRVVPAATARAEVDKRRWPVAALGVLCTLNGIAPVALAIAFQH